MALVVSLCLVWVYAFCVVGGIMLPSNSVAKIRVNSLDHCPELPGLKSSFDDLTMFPDPENTDMMYADGTLTIGTEIPADTILRVDYRKCYTQAAESCEKYLVTDVRNVCDQLVDESKSWSLFIKKIDGFNPKCPIQPGTYTLDEAPIDLSPFENMTEFVGHWQIELSFVTKKDALGCILADVEVYLKNKNNRS